MRSRSLATDHDVAVARRLELLTSELAAVRDDSDGACRLVGSARPHPDPRGPRRRARGRARPGGTAATAAGGADARPPCLASDDRAPRRLGRARARPAARASVARARTAGGGRRGGRGGARRHVLVPGPQRRPRGRRPGRCADRPPPPSSRPQGSVAPVGATARASGPSAPASRVVVDVAGKVRRPGIAVLHAGARVVDALRAAGGARPGVDLGALNLAQVLTDGEQIVVGRPGAGRHRRRRRIRGATGGDPRRPQHRRPDGAGVPARGRPGDRPGDPRLAHRARWLQCGRASSSTSTGSVTPPSPS